MLLGRYRFVQTDGQVMMVRAYCHENIYPHITKHIDALLGTVEFREPAPDPDPDLPEGFEMTEMDGFEVWTDGASKSTLKSVVKQTKTAFGYLDDMFEGDPRDTRPVRLIICKEPGPYAELQQLFSQGVGWKAVFAERHRRAIVVSESESKKNAFFEADLSLHAGIVRTRQHFGGPVPYWLEFGLGLHARMVSAWKGKNKPASRELKRAKYAIEERQSTLSDLFGLIPDEIAVDDLEAANFEMWAWHWYLTYGPCDKAHRKAYQDHLRVLRETADPAEARKVWDDTNLEALRDAFVAWSKNWK